MRLVIVAATEEEGGRVDDEGVFASLLLVATRKPNAVRPAATTALISIGSSGTWCSGIAVFRCAGGEDDGSLGMGHGSDKSDTRPPL